MCCKVSFAGMCACTEQAWAWVTHGGGGIGKLGQWSLGVKSSQFITLFYPLALHGSHEN
jgi:hypothetical protein